MLCRIIANIEIAGSILLLHNTTVEHNYLP